MNHGAVSGIGGGVHRSKTEEEGVSPMSTPGRSGYAGGSAGCAPMMTHYDFEKR
jgi:hypothetical protein